jgi:hypothetical protein
MLAKSSSDNHEAKSALRKILTHAEAGGRIAEAGWKGQALLSPTCWVMFPVKTNSRKKVGKIYQYGGTSKNLKRAKEEGRQPK